MELTSVTPLLKNLKLSVLFTTLILFSYTDLHAQERTNSKPPLKERLFYGGNFGLQFGTITEIEVSPVVGLWILPRLAVAAGPDYTYYKYFGDPTAIYGGSCYTQFVVIRDINSFLPIGSNTGIFIQIENELLSLKTSFWKEPPYSSDRFFVNTLLVGAGISQQIGRRASFDISFLWPVNETEYGLYSKPEIRMNFIF
jgi:hypothetical protein